MRGTGFTPSVLATVVRPSGFLRQSTHRSGCMPLLAPNSNCRWGIHRSSPLLIWAGIVDDCGIFRKYADPRALDTQQLHGCRAKTAPRLLASSRAVRRASSSTRTRYATILPAFLCSRCFFGRTQTSKGHAQMLLPKGEARHRHAPYILPMAIASGKGATDNGIFAVPAFTSTHKCGLLTRCAGFHE